MNIIITMRAAARALRRLADGVAQREIEDIAQQLDDAVAEPERAVDLAMCIGSECIKLHGLRVATWRGIGPSSIYCGVCDECYEQRLTAEERAHMVELFGAAWVRHLGLHKLHNGREVKPRPSVSLRIKVSQIPLLIGLCGKTIKAIVEQTGVTADVDGDGVVCLSAADPAIVTKAVEIVESLCAGAVRICGARLDGDACHREPNHGGKHCPIAGCEDDHG